MEREYVLDTGSDLGRRQLDCLQTLLDPYTTQTLDAAGVRPGMRCLDLGAGGGSITQWLSERVGPEGTVVAVDLDTDWLREKPGIEVYRHDINDGLPVDGPFDLIHARLLLMHLSRREEILALLVDALAPGGALVLGEYCGPPQHVLSAPSDADEQLFLRVQEEAHTYLTREHGIAYDWAGRVDAAFAAAGLVDIRGTAVSMTTTGGDLASELHRNYILQLEDVLAERSELTRDELTRYVELVLDPRFRAWFYQFICTSGRRPE